MNNKDLTPNALVALNRRYFIKDKKGKVVEDWKKLCKRVSSAIAQDEKSDIDRGRWQQKYYDIINNLYFLPNSPTLMNAGKKNGQLAACFVLGIEDSMKSIMKATTDAAFIHKSGGGTGFDFSRLRPSKSRVATTSGTASGPISFMRMINNVTEEIKQGGTRRGANMGILRCDHPNILEFIDCKQDTSQINNFNISVALTDKFMKALSLGEDYSLIDPRDGKEIEKISAKKVFEKIAENAWKTGEPGIIFIDEINKKNQWGEIRATNPCGEQPLRDNESCNLGSMNLSLYVNKDGVFDKDLFDEHIKIATRFLDSVISMNSYPLEEIKKTHAETRKIGLGVMGFADALILSEIEYGSVESFQFANYVYSWLNDASKQASEELGKEKGICFACEELKLKRRNLWTTTIAPTGTISIIAGCSSGIEPLFAVGYERNILDGDKLLEINKHFLSEVCGGEDLEREICSSNSIQNIKGIPAKIRKKYVTSHDVSLENHIKMQSVFQKHSDSGISKTINLSSDAKKEDVIKAYLLAYKLECKGITVYRDGCRDNQPMRVKKEEVVRKTFNRISVMKGSTEKIETPLGGLLLTINENVHGEPGEVILNIGKSGADVNAFCEALGRIISIGLQHGLPAHKIAKQLRRIKGEDIIFHDGKKYTSLPDIIGKRLAEKAKEKSKDNNERLLAKCPSCGERLFNAEGCSQCTSCGYSKC